MVVCHDDAIAPPLVAARYDLIAHLPAVLRHSPIACRCEIAQKGSRQFQ